MKAMSLKAKQATLKKFCILAPQWGAILTTWDGKKSIHTPTTKLEMTDPRHCIIGEAHGFTDHYTENCQTCERTGYKLIDLTGGEMPTRRGMASYQRGWHDLHDFIKHFNEVHKK